MSDIKEAIQAEDKLIIEQINSVLDSFEEVSRLSSGLIESFAKNILKSDVNEGIEISRDKNGISISIRLVIFYGVNIPQLSYNIQMKLFNALEKEANIKVQEINIIVEGIERK